jgi:TolA-binding protein
MDNPLNTDIDKKIKDYLDGKLSAPQIDGLWADILANPEYLGHLKTEAQLRAHFEQKRGDMVGKSRQRYRKPAAVALAAIVVITIGILWSRFANPASDDYRALAGINVFDMETPAVTRSDNDQYHPSDLLLIEAFDLVLDGSNDEAESLMLRIIGEFPGTPAAVHASLNLGILAYNGQDYDQAVRFFDNASNSYDQDQALRQKALWFLANAALNAGRRDIAAEAAREASAIDGFYTVASTGMYEALSAEL